MSETGAHHPDSPTLTPPVPLGAVATPDDAAALSPGELHALAESLVAIADTIDSSAVGTRHGVSDELRVLIAGSFDCENPAAAHRIAADLAEAGDPAYAMRMRAELETFVSQRSMGLTAWEALTGLEGFADEDALYAWLQGVVTANFAS